VGNYTHSAEGIVLLLNLTMPMASQMLLSFVLATFLAGTAAKVLSDTIVVPNGGMIDELPGASALLGIHGNDITLIMTPAKITVRKKGRGAQHVA